MTERKTLIITEAKEPRAIGSKGTKVVDFKAKDGEKELLFSAFFPRFFPHLKAGQTIDADVETTEKDNFINRKLTELYVDGKPIESKKQFGRGEDDSPEKRASIEAQSAFQGVVELLVSKVIDLNHPFARVAIKWGLEKLGGAPPIPVPPKQPEGEKPIEVKPPEKPAVVAPVTPTPSEKPKLTDKSKPGPPFANKGEFFTAAAARWPDMWQTRVLGLLNKKLGELGDLTEEWNTLLMLKGEWTE